MLDFSWIKMDCLAYKMCDFPKLFNCFLKCLYCFTFQGRSEWRTSLVVQWLWIHLASQGMWVQSLIQELQSHMLRATKFAHLNYWALPQLGSPCTKNEKILPEEAKISRPATKTRCSQINIYIFFKKMRYPVDLSSSVDTSSSWNIFNTWYYQSSTVILMDAPYCGFN